MKSYFNSLTLSFHFSGPHSHKMTGLVMYVEEFLRKCALRVWNQTVLRQGETVANLSKQLLRLSRYLLNCLIILFI